MRFIVLLLFLPKLLFADDIEQLLNQYPRISASIIYEDLNTGKVLYSRNAQEFMIPASSAKSFTSFAALKFLGKNFSYSTQLLKQGDDFYLKFSGDPSLKITDLKELLKALPKKHIFIDDSAFDQQLLGYGWSWEDSKFCFSAPISAIIVNKNCFNATLQASGKLAAENVYVKIHNNTITKDDPKCNLDLKLLPDESYQLSGCVNKDIPLNIAYQNPRQMLKNMLKGYNLEFKAAPREAVIIAEHKSEKLDELLKVVMKDSDNLYSNAIAKTIGEKYFNEQGSFENAVEAIKQITDVSAIRLMDGSGTSRYNLIAANQLLALFKSAFHNQKIWPDFYNNLPIYGIDGSLKDLTNKNLQGKVRAKTGSMSGVLVLVGFVDKNKVFVIMLNNFIQSRTEMLQLSEQILLRLTLL